MKISAMVMAAFVVVSSSAMAQGRDRGGQRRSDQRSSQRWFRQPAALNQYEVYEIVDAAYRNVLGRPAQGTPAEHFAYWNQSLTGLNRQQALGYVEATLRASDEYRCRIGQCGMPEYAFNGLIYRLSNAPFSSDRIGLVQHSTGQRLSVAQLSRVLQLMRFSDERAIAVEVFGPNLMDPQNAHLLDQHLVFMGERERAHRALRRG